MRRSYPAGHEDASWLSLMEWSISPGARAKSSSRRFDCSSIKRSRWGVMHGFRQRLEKASFRFVLTRTLAAWQVQECEPPQQPRRQIEVYPTAIEHRIAHYLGDGMIRVGVGGWVFAPWRGTFYPPGLPQSRELEYAS